MIGKLSAISNQQSAIKRYYRLNQYIQAKQIRVVDEKGNQLGVMSLDEALFKSRQACLDLVEVAPEAKPPVCKIIDFKKFKYQEDKKQKAGNKKSKSADIKEIRFTPFIAKNDLEIRIKKAKDFLKEGSKIRLTVKFTGRQITKKQFGYEILKQANNRLNNISRVETAPKWQGKLLMQVLAPNKNAQEKN